MLELKQKLINEIHKITNEDILNQLSELLIETEDSLEIDFSEDQIKKINESQLQIKNGESFDHNEVMEIVND